MLPAGELVNVINYECGLFSRGETSAENYHTPSDVNYSSVKVSCCVVDVP